MKKQPAVFFDRDGVLNIDHGYTYRIEEFEWIPGAKEIIAELKKAGWLVFVITNQSGVARGYYNEEDVKRLHQFMNEELQRSEGCQIDAFYYCPHHPEGVVEIYKKECDCRKPQPGLIVQAMEEWPICSGKSFVVGDKDSDIMAAQAAGIMGYLFEGQDLRIFFDENSLREKIRSR